jgi:hypothetical protein
MRIRELLHEGATDVLYHYAPTRAAAQILADGEFRLSRATGSVEQQYAPPDRPYFLSTTHSKVGDYHRYTGTSGVMFVLDGRWFNSRYQVKPVDYWDRAWLNNPTRTSESEERVFSREPTIPIAGVVGMHVLLKEQDDFRSPYTRKILLNARRLGIPVHLYQDESAWRLQDVRKSIAPSAASELLKGPEHIRRQSRPETRYLEPWIELMYKKSRGELSPKAEKLRYNLVYYGLRHATDDSGLGNDLSNARKPDSADWQLGDKIIQFMRANKLKTPVDLKNLLAKKWDAIKT